MPQSLLEQGLTLCSAEEDSKPGQVPGGRRSCIQEAKGRRGLEQEPSANHSGELEAIFQWAIDARSFFHGTVPPNFFLEMMRPILRLKRNT